MTPKNIAEFEKTIQQEYTSTQILDHNPKPRKNLKG